MQHPMASPRRADDMATDTVTPGDDRSVLTPDPIADLSPAHSLRPGSSDVQHQLGASGRCRRV